MVRLGSSRSAAGGAELTGGVLVGGLAGSVWVLEGWSTGEKFAIGSMIPLLTWLLSGLVRAAA